MICLGERIREWRRRAYGVHLSRGALFVNAVGLYGKCLGSLASQRILTA